MEKKVRFFGYGIFVLLIVILGAWFVMAVIVAPTGLIIEQNVTALYDEGTFTVNWTSGEGDAEANYTIYIWAGGSLINTTVQNDSTTGLSYVNTTEANYSFTIEAYNGTAVSVNSSSNVSMYVDVTGPVVNFTGYTNATYKKNTDTLILNISVGDALSGLTGSNCLIDVNGTNQTVVVSGIVGRIGWCNTTSLSLTGLSSDGNHTIKVYANDTINTVGSNESFFVVWIDNTAPTATFSCTPLSVFATETVTCTCTGADASSGVSTTSFIASPAVSDTGTFTTTCTVTDNAGNSLISSISYVVGGIKSSGGVVKVPVTTAAEKKKNSWSEITPEKGAVMKDFNKEIGIKQIQINVNNKALDVGITVTKHSGKPAEVSISKSGKLYRYLQVETRNLKDKLDRAIITIQVEKSWVSNNGLEIDDVALFKFDETEDLWNELATTYREEDDTYHYYDIEVSSFSFFAIGEKVVITDEGEEVGVSEEREAKKTSGGLTWLWILIVVLILIAIGWSKKKKK